MKTDYLSLEGMSETLFIEKQSKFYAYACCIKIVDEAKHFIEKIKNLHPKASHHCYAYKIGIMDIQCRLEDDGEPSGTAGKPIFGQIESFGLNNTIIVVTRYFGGTKLGTSGLTKAYKSASRLCLESAKIIKNEIKVNYKIESSDENMYKIIKIAKQLNLKYSELAIDLNSAIKIQVELKMEKEFLNCLKMQIDQLDSWDEKQVFQLRNCKINKLDLIL